MEKTWVQLDEPLPVLPRPLTMLEQSMAAESGLESVCERVWPGEGREHAQKIMARSEAAWRKDREIVVLMLGEVFRSRALA